MRTSLKALLVIMGLFLLSGIHLSSQAQAKYSLTGKLVRSVDEKPMEGATVILYSADGSVYDSSVTVKDGSFKLRIEDRRFILEIKNLNQLLHAQSLFVEKDTDLGTLKVKPAKVRSDE